MLFQWKLQSYRKVLLAIFPVYLIWNLKKFTAWITYTYITYQIKRLHAEVHINFINFSTQLFQSLLYKSVLMIISVECKIIQSQNWRAKNIKRKSYEKVTKVKLRN